MLTIVDTVSVAGARAKQNDDAFGWTERYAWVIDGATDLYDDPVMGAASDAAWFAQRISTYLHRHAHEAVTPESLLAAAAEDAGRAFHAVVADPIAWRRPAGTIVLAWEIENGVAALDLGDSRLFALDADGQALAFGGREETAAAETAQVMALTGGNTETPLQRADVLDGLRATHLKRNVEGGWWVLAPSRRCADFVRRHEATLARPAHLILATDGFAALADRYRAYDPAGLVTAARDKGLAALAVELRAIEDEDANGGKHPRWKRSDDATALLLRLD